MLYLSPRCILITELFLIISQLHLLMMWCIKSGLFVTLWVYGGFFWDIFLHSLKIWSRSYQLTQPVLLIHKLFLFLQYFFWLLPIVSSYNGERKCSWNNRIRKSLKIFCLKRWLLWSNDFGSVIRLRHLVIHK